MKPRLKLVVRTLAAFALSAGLVAWVLSRADLSALARRTADMRPLPMLVAAGCSMAVLLLRAQRFYALAERSPYPVVVAAVAVQNFLVRVTPFRVGELGLPVVLQRHADEPLVRSVVNVVLVRLVELWMLLLLGAGATAAYVGPSGGLGSTLTLSLLAAVTAAVFTFRWWLGALTALARRLWPRGDGTTSLGAKIHKTLDRLTEVLADGSRLSLSARLRLGLGTGAIAIFQYSLYAALLAVFGVSVGPVEVLVGGTAAQFAAAVPVPSVGCIGPLESAWVAGFTWVGVSLDDAIVTAVGCQVITLVFAGVFAALAWFWLGARRRA